MSLLTAEDIQGLTTAGVPLKELSIIEDLTRMLWVKNPGGAVSEAYTKWREIKRKQTLIKAKADKDAKAHMDKMESMANHGDILSMANGKVYSSKSSYRADLKAMGYAEVGNEDTVKEGKRVAARLEKEKQQREKGERLKLLAEITTGANITI